MEINCPSCSASYPFQQAFDSAFCWAGTAVAIAFKCPRCGGTQYFGPRGAELEVGFVGAGPPIDPIPMNRYQIAVEIARTGSGQELLIEYEGVTRLLPSAVEYTSNRYR